MTDEEIKKYNEIILSKHPEMKPYLPRIVNSDEFYNYLKEKNVKESFDLEYITNLINSSVRIKIKGNDMSKNFNIFVCHELKFANTIDNIKILENILNDEKEYHIVEKKDFTLFINNNEKFALKKVNDRNYLICQNSKNIDWPNIFRKIRKAKSMNPKAIEDPNLATELNNYL